jgi:hypothetical protein
VSLAGFNLSTETGAQWKAGIFPAWVNAVWVLIICRRSQSAGNSSSTTLLSRVLLFAFRLTKAVYRKHNILKPAKYHSNPTSGRRHHYTTTPLHHYTGLGAWNSVILESLPLSRPTTTLDRESVCARTSTSMFGYHQILHNQLLSPPSDCISSCQTQTQIFSPYQHKHIPIIKIQPRWSTSCTTIESARPVPGLKIRSRVGTTPFVPTSCST